MSGLFEALLRDPATLQWLREHGSPEVRATLAQLDHAATLIGKPTSVWLNADGSTTPMIPASASAAYMLAGQELEDAIMSGNPDQRVKAEDAWRDAATRQSRAERALLSDPAVARHAFRDVNDLLGEVVRLRAALTEAEQRIERAQVWVVALVNGPQDSMALHHGIRAVAAALDGPQQ